MHITVRVVKFIVSLIAIYISFSGYVGATNVLPEGALAVVNGKIVPQIYLDLAIKTAIIQGSQSSESLQNTIKQKLITTAVLSQESIRQGLDTSLVVQAAIAQSKENILAEALISNYLEKNPIKDLDLKQEYERQIGLLGSSGLIPQYQVSDMAFASESDARVALSRIDKGEPFSSVAKEMSLSKSKDNGGSLGWIYLNQLPPLVAKVVASMSKNTVSKEPINSGNGWYLIKLNEKKMVKPPTFEEAKNAVRSTLVQIKINNYISKLRGEATVIE